MATNLDDPPERRSAERHPGQWSVTIRNDGVVYKGACTNLSTTGMAASGIEGLPIGAIVDAQLETGGGRHIEITAEVVRVQEAGLMGLRFISIDANALMLLLRLLARQP